MCVQDMVLFHPVTGLGPCSETEAWASYTQQQQRLAPRDSPLMYLRAKGAGRPVRLGLACTDYLARWRLVSDSKLHVAANASSPGSGMLCQDVGADRRSVVTSPCRYLSADNSCDPENQWLKLVSSTRSVAATKSMLAQLPLRLKNWKIRSI